MAKPCVQMRPFYSATECFLRDFLKSWARSPVSEDPLLIKRVCFCRRSGLACRASALCPFPPNTAAAALQ
jgi:hypothetical protein